WRLGQGAVAVIEGADGARYPAHRAQSDLRAQREGEAGGGNRARSLRRGRWRRACSDFTRGATTGDPRAADFERAVADRSAGCLAAADYTQRPANPLTVRSVSGAASRGRARYSAFECGGRDPAVGSQ